MSTSGLTGFIIDGATKLSFQTYDSNLDRVGLQVLQFCRDVTDWVAVRQGARDLVVVDPEDEPSVEQLAALEGRWQRDRHPEDSWFSHLEKTQGCPGLILEAGFVTDPELEDYYIEFSYFIDFDKAEFRAYKADFDVSVKGGDIVTTGGPRLLGAWPLDALPHDEEFLSLE